MKILNRSLQPDNIISNVVALRNDRGVCKLIAIVQGCNLGIIDDFVNYTIKATFPFQNPIIVIAPVGDNADSLFILLRNYNWYIFTRLKIVRFGSLVEQNSAPAIRPILRRASILSPPPSGSNIIATNNILFSESQIAYAMHSKFIALRLYHKEIIILSYYDNRLFTIPWNLSNIVDMAFIGPYVNSTRLAFITESPNENRILNIYKLNKDETAFEKELTLDIPQDAHSILALNPIIESTFIIFTRDRIIRVNAAVDLPPNVEHLATFMPSIVLRHCHFYDDIYLFCDSTGGLSGGKFPISGRPSTEKMTEVGPASGIVAIDNNNFLITSPFGDSIAYNCIVHDNGFTLQEVARIKSLGPILNLSYLKEDIYCLAGRGNTTSIRKFENALSCEKVCEIQCENCYRIFTASNEKSLIIALCSINKTRFLRWDGSEIKDFEINGKNTAEETILCAEISGSLIHITSTSIVFYNIETGEEELSRDFSTDHITSAAISEKYIVVACQKNTIRVINNNPELKSFKKWTINKQVGYLAINNDSYAAFCIDNTLFMYSLVESKQKEMNSIPTANPVSMALTKDNQIIIGTIDGKLIKINKDMDQVETEDIGSRTIILHSIDESSLIGSGSLPFIYDDSNHYINICDCDDIGISGKYICCLQQQSKISIYTINSEYSGSTKVIVERPNIINFAFLSDDAREIVCHVEELEESSRKDAIVVYENGIETNKFVIAENDVSLFKVVSFEDKQIIIVGDAGKDLLLLDEKLHLICSQKMIGVPTAACSFGEYLVIARSENVDFYVAKNLDNQYEIDRKFICSIRVCATDLANFNDKFIVVAGGGESIQILSIDESSINERSCDSSPKCISCLAIFNNYVFAADYFSGIYCYEIDETGNYYEIGSFQTDSRVLSMTVNDDHLIYGTEYGGIGQLDLTNEEAYGKLRDAIEEENIQIIKDTKVHTPIPEWDQENIFVNMNSLSLIKNLDEESVNRILTKADITQEQLDQLLAQ